MLNPQFDPGVMDLVTSRYPQLSIPCRAVPVSPAVAGFSGARLWRLESGQHQFCLRNWPPEHPSRDRLEYIHTVLRHVAAAGLGIIPVPLVDKTGQSIVECAGLRWELTPWLAGSADFHQHPNDTRLFAAMSVLARFHQAAATILPCSTAVPPSVWERRRRVAELVPANLGRITVSVRPADWPTLATMAYEFVQLVPRVLDRVSARLRTACRYEVALQPCIRDIWHDHILFTGDEVTGIVDFGALRTDTVACDVARLRGSLVADDLQQQAAAMCAYESVRPLAAAERELVETLDESAIPLSGLNWLEWIYVEQREFADRRRVEQRLAALLHRLRCLAARCL